MRTWNTVAIVGVGLIGGSIGLALRERKAALRVIGIGRRRETLETALRVGAISEIAPDLAAGVAEADLIVVATPVDLIADYVLQISQACPRHALITDAGSTKVEILRELAGKLPTLVRFVGSHPIAGSEKQGPAEANGKLFENRVVVVTQAANTPADDVSEAEAFWSRLGARVVLTTPDDHDQRLAASSHVPHLVAALLAGSTPPEAFPFAGSGFRDTTRVASGDPGLWTQILLSNRVQVLSALDPVEEAFKAAREALRSGDANQLRSILMEAKNKRDALGS